MKKTYMTLLLAAVALLASAEAPNGSGTYYQNANGYKGSALKTKLCSIIYNRTEKSYDYLWTAFQTTDVRSDGKVWDMYSSITNFRFGTDQAGNFNGENQKYNREHSFPKSWFGGEVMPMYSDLHHMYPTDGYVNNMRGNLPFGKVSNPTYSSSGGFSKVGPCSYSGYTGKVFEPADEYKGDFARTYFYMVTCYEEKLADWYSKNSESRTTINGTKYPAFQSWQLNMLMEWATADPVSEKEKNRNNAVYGIQNNRNPFIDYPGLEQYIWGNKTDVAFSYDNYEGGSSGSGEGGDPDPGTGTETEGGTDVINLAFTGITANSTSYSDWSGKSGSASSAVYAGNSAGGNSSIQLRSSESNSGIVTTASGGKVTKVVVTWNSNTSSGRTLDVYGKNTAYSAATDLYNSSTQGTKLGSIICGTSTELTISGDYTSVGLRSNSGAMYLTKIEITWDDGSTPVVKTDPTFNGLTDLSVNWETSLTLTKGTTGTPNFVTDGTVTLSSLNTEVATVDGLTITPVAVGTAMISVSTTATDAYNAGSVMFPITVNAPEGKTTAPTSVSGELFTESFGNNTGSARNWSDDYSVKSGVSAVYSGASYIVTDAKQSKNTMGQTASALVSGSGAVGTFIVGPLNVVGYSNLTVSNYFGMSSGSWSSNSYMKLYYSTSTASNRTYAEVSRTDSNTPSGAVLSNSNYVQATYNLPQAAQSNTLYLKFEFYCYQVNKNSEAIGQAYLDGVSLSGTSAATLTKTLNDYGYASYCSEYPLDFSDYESAGYSAWQVTGVSGETITFAQVTGKVKGGTGLILKGEPNETITLNSAASTTTLGDNLLVGTIVDTYAETGQYFGLKGNAFVPVAESTVPAGKALLPASALGSNVKAFTFVFEEDATGISLMEDGRSQMEDGVNYKQGSTIVNLAGQRLDNSQLKRGIYIVNGKKILK